MGGSKGMEVVMKSRRLVCEFEFVATFSHGGFNRCTFVTVSCIILRCSDMRIIVNHFKHM